jgi:Flp pilus assembly protein protease CpaA
MTQAALQIAATGAFWAIALALVFSCLTDLRYRIVCDEVSLVVFVASLVLFVSRDLPSSYEWLAYGAIVVAVLGAAMAGVMGGGDAKLVFALLPGMTAIGCLQFVVVTSVAGGALGLGVLALSRLLRGRRASGTVRPHGRHPLAQWLRHETARLRRGRSIPYVPAIALGWFAAVQAL